MRVRAWETGFFTTPARQGCTSARPETYVHMRRIHMRRPQSAATTYQTGLAFGNPPLLPPSHCQPSSHGSLWPRRDWLLAFAVGKWANATDQVSNLRMLSLGSIPWILGVPRATPAATAGPRTQARTATPRRSKDTAQRKGP